MKVALIGATGFTGSAILNELLERGHKVTAIMRNPEKLKASGNMIALKADVSDERAVSAAVADNDAVVSAFNAGWTNPNLYQDFINGSKAIQAGVKAAGIKRLIVVGVQEVFLLQTDCN